MKDMLIQQYIDRMTLEDVNSFAVSNGIILKDEELKLIYNHIITNWRTIIYGNPRPILDDLKSQIDEVSYKKIEALYVQFKNRYYNIL